MNELNAMMLASSTGGIDLLLMIFVHVMIR
jgi:hypothetical protein